MKHTVIRNVILFLLLIAGAFASARAQEVTAAAKVDSNNIRIGDWLRVHIEVTHPANVAVTWPAVFDSLQGLELLNHSAPAPVSSGGTVTDTSTWTVTSFDSGTVVIPPLPFTYAAAGDTAKKTAVTSPIPVFVHGIAVDTTKDIKDVKAPLSIPLSFAEILPYLIGIIVIGGLIWLAFYIIGKRKRGESIIPEAPRRPAHEIALDALRSLEAEKVWQRGKVKEYHSQLTDILRTYIENRFKVPAMELTTEEIMTGIKPLGLPSEAKDQLHAILVRADFAKFAKFLPTPEENEASMAQAVTFVQSTWRIQVPEPKPVEPAETGPLEPPQEQAASVASVKEAVVK